MEQSSLAERAARHAALGEPMRLTIVDELLRTDRSPAELGQALGVASNLLAHHLDVLEAVGIIQREASAGDRRRRYVRLVHEALPTLPSTPQPLPERVLFLCTANSARSQLAAALWTARTGQRATSAGTHPAPRVHRGAVAAARRAGVSLADAQPRTIDDTELAQQGTQVITVCDRAHEELPHGARWWHWSIADPVDDGSAAAFDRVVDEVETRIRTLLHASTSTSERSHR